MYNGSYVVGSSGATLGPKKIVGNLSVGSGAALRISGTIWVTGNLTINGGSSVRPDDSSKSYALVVDGTVTLSGGANIYGGGKGSHILIVSLSSADPAINLNGGANDTVVYVPDGGLYVSGGAHIKAAAAKHITADGGADIQYDPDVSALNLTSGSGGAFGIKSWKETE
jgi:choice-of-anchor A domain-containing protein